MNNFVIEAKNINKYFKKKQVLQNVSLQIKEGEIYGILGPNGAGKTTLISILSGILTPESGDIKIFGQDAKTNFQETKKSLNVCSGNPNFIWCMTVLENLNYFGMLYGLNKKERAERIKEYSSLLGLNDFLKERFDTLSTGTKQKLALGKSLINDPKILFLDEPTIGLDPDMSIKVRNLIKNLNQNKKITMLITTHVMKEAEILCDRIAFLKKGEIIREGTAQDIKNKLKLNNLEDVFVELSK